MLLQSPCLVLRSPVAHGLAIPGFAPSFVDHLSRVPFSLSLPSRFSTPRSHYFCSFLLYGPESAFLLFLRRIYPLQDCRAFSSVSTRIETGTGGKIPSLLALDLPLCLPVPFMVRKPGCALTPGSGTLATNSPKDESPKPPLCPFSSSKILIILPGDPPVPPASLPDHAPQPLSSATLHLLSQSLSL